MGKNSSDFRSDRTLIDLLIIAVIGFSVFIFAFVFDVFEIFIKWTRQWEEHEVDEFIPVFVALVICLCIFLFRRWRELKHELARSRQAEEALRGKLGQLTALIENLQMGVLVEDDARHVLHVNQKFCEMFGVKSASSVIGASCKEALDAVKSSVANSEEFLQSVEQRLAVREAVISEKIVTAEGRVFERDYVAILIGEGQKGSLWLYRDATEPPKTARRATVY